MTALLPDLTPAEAVLMDAMLAHGWTPGQCRMAFAASARGTVVTARSELRRDAYTGLTRQSAGEWQLGMVLQRLGTEAAKLAHVTYDTDTDGSMVLEVRLLVVPGLDVAGEASAAARRASNETAKPGAKP